MAELNNPISITEENNKADIDQWFQDAAKQTFDTLPEFIRHVMNDYVHDYEKRRADQWHEAERIARENLMRS